MKNNIAVPKHKNLQAVKSKDTKIELLLRKELWRRGLRYRKNVNSIFGRPDIVFTGKKIAVFCDSEFWHGYEWDKQKAKIKNNRNFWISKIERNMVRDKEVNEYLIAHGWKVIRFWGKQIQNDVAGCADTIENEIYNHTKITSSLKQ